MKAEYIPGSVIRDLAELVFEILAGRPVYVGELLVQAEELKRWKTLAAKREVESWRVRYAVPVQAGVDPAAPEGERTRWRDSSRRLFPNTISARNPGW